MNGILIIDKPEGYTSHDVVNRLRRILKTKRIGHTGTLDPFATGVLVMLVGKATRLAQFIDKDEKEYEAVVRFGFETDTGDRTGMQDAGCRMRDDEVTERLSHVDWETVFSQFRGEIEQIPPMYSAKKVDGKKLYESARKGIEVERQAARVNIRELEIIGGETIPDPRSPIRIRVVCSAGTYVRTLAEHIGRAVGTGAHLAELRRTRAGKFSITDSITIDELEKLDESGGVLQPIEVAVEHLPPFALSAERAEKTAAGLSTLVDQGTYQDKEYVRMHGPKSELIAIGVFDSGENRIKPKIVLV